MIRMDNGGENSLKAEMLDEALTANGRHGLFKVSSRSKARQANTP